MATKFLDEQRTALLWSKTKEYVNNQVSGLRADVQSAADELSAALGDPVDDPTTEGGEQYG